MSAASRLCRVLPEAVGAGRVRQGQQADRHLPAPAHLRAGRGVLR